MTNYPLGDDKHPIWSFMRFAIVCGMMLGVLYMNASNFDQTELTAWIQFILAVGGMKGAEAGIKKLLGKKECDHPDHDNEPGHE